MARAVDTAMKVAKDQQKVVEVQESMVPRLSLLDRTGRAYVTEADLPYFVCHIPTNDDMRKAAAAAAAAAAASSASSAAGKQPQQQRAEEVLTCVVVVVVVVRSSSLSCTTQRFTHTHTPTSTASPSFVGG